MTEKSKGEKELLPSTEATASAVIGTRDMFNFCFGSTRRWTDRLSACATQIRSCAAYTFTYIQELLAFQETEIHSAKSREFMDKYSVKKTT